MAELPYCSPYYPDRHGQPCKCDDLHVLDAGPQWVCPMWHNAVCGFRHRLDRDWWGKPSCEFPHADPCEQPGLRKPGPLRKAAACAGGRSRRRRPKPSSRTRERARSSGGRAQGIGGRRARFPAPSFIDLSIW